jgi:hypothetical protein
MDGDGNGQLKNWKSWKSWPWTEKSSSVSTLKGRLVEPTNYIFIHSNKRKIIDINAVLCTISSLYEYENRRRDNANANIQPQYSSKHSLG